MPNISIEPEFIQQQLAFAAYIRDPDHAPYPANIEKRRMAIYCELFFNNVESLLASNFPVLHTILSNEHWRSMIRDFLIKHRCKTPHFLELAEEFLLYLQQERVVQDWEPPFMLELAHYEWVELAVSISNADASLPILEPNGNLLEGIPVVSPIVWNLSYQFPVHRIALDFQPNVPGNEKSHLVVYRDCQDRVHFLEINQVTQKLLKLLQDNNDQKTGRDILHIIATELGYAEPDQILFVGQQMLLDLKHRDIILGTLVTER